MPPEPSSSREGSGPPDLTLAKVMPIDNIISVDRPHVIFVKERHLFMWSLQAVCLLITTRALTKSGVLTIARTGVVFIRTFTTPIVNSAYFLYEYLTNWVRLASSAQELRILILW